MTIVERDIARIEAQMAEVNERLAALEEQVTEIRMLVRAQGATCPYRDDIVRARNHIQRLTDIEKRVHDLELAMARSGAIGGIAGGGIVGIITMGLFGLGKLLGWW